MTLDYGEERMQCSYAEDCRLHESIRALVFPKIKKNPEGFPVSTQRKSNEIQNQQTK